MGKGRINKRVVIGVVVGAAVLAIVLGVAIGVPLSQQKRSTGNDESNLDRANRVLEESPLIDGHNDLSWQFRKNVENHINQVDLRQSLKGHWNITHTDIPRLRKGKLGAQFWACYVPCSSQYNDAVRISLDQLDTIKRFVSQYNDVFEFVTTADGILKAFENGKIASLVGLEGGHSIDSSLATLRMFYDLGVRYMTVTHSCNTPWADNWKVDVTENPDPAFSNGLSPFGKKVIMEMNRLGMLVDLSHVSKKTMEDALELTTAPVIFSHTSAFTLCNHYRNAQDDVLVKTKNNGGVVMVNFFDLYINCYPSNQTTANLSQVADHIDYIKNVAGVDHVGIGADYDGVPTVPVGLEDVSKYPDLFAELIRRGWSDDDLKKLAGKNLIRVFKKAEEVARGLQADSTGYDDLIDKTRIKDTSCRPDF